VTGEAFDNDARYVPAFAGVKGGALDLDVKARVAAALAIQALDEFDFLIEGVNLKTRLAKPETRREDGLACGVNALVGVKLSDFFQSEVQRVEVSVRAGPAGKTRGYVGSTF